MIVPAYFIIIAVLNPTEEFGIIANDFDDVYDDITSIYDYDIRNVDHWCLTGGDDGCRCEDPLTPQPRGEYRSWTRAHESNLEDIKRVVEMGKSIDIAFVGESVVEEMDGRWMGQSGTQLQRLGDLFNKRFDTDKGGKLNGIALGVAGDTVRSWFAVFVCAQVSCVLIS